jgi:hypothetical protein
MGHRDWPELPGRLRARIAELGYKNPSRFADDKRYRVTELHKWLTNVTPSRATLERLANDLQVTPQWLLFGDVCGAPKAPPRPRKRDARALKCLVAAVGLTTATMVPVHARTLPMGGPLLNSFLSEVLASRRKPLCVRPLPDSRPLAA